MKKWLSVLLCLVTLFSVFSFSGCGGSSEEEENELEREIEKFAEYLAEQDVEKAVSYYAEEIAGDEDLEASAVVYFETAMKDLESDILSGEIKVEDGQKTADMMSEVYSGTGIAVDYDNYSASVEEALASRVAYKSGCSLMENEHYIDAISEFKKVVKGDADYDDAQSKLKECEKTYLDSVAEEVKAAKEGHDYEEAIQILEKAVKVFPNDAQLLADLNTCEKEHIQYIIDSAEKAFTDNTKYEEALAVIQKGIQLYPGNDSLLTKRDYYNGFRPVALWDMDPVMGEASTYSTDSGTYGDSYINCFWHGYGSYGIYSGEINIVYDLKAQYNTFTATIYGRSNKTESGQYSVCIYGDGILLYENKNVIDNARPFDISVNVTGVKDLKIVTDRLDGRVSKGIGLANMYLYKVS